MALPNPSMSFSPFAILTAAEMNDLVENDQALAAGTGLNSNVVTASKIDFTTFLSGYNSGSTVTINTASTYTLATVDVTAFPTGSIIQVYGSATLNKTTGTASYAPFCIRYNSINYGEITSNQNSMIASGSPVYMGLATIGQVTKVSGVNSITLMLTTDGTLTGGQAKGYLMVNRVK